tara:strand:+ start:702 stop:1184 length:483 start_codon:yes stop_codon:yes gene_type:complete
MTDHTHRDLIVEEHYKSNIDRLIKRFSFKLGNYADACDVVHMAYELSMRYYGGRRGSDFDPWFNQILKNAKSKFVNEKRAAGLTSCMWDMWEIPPPEPLALEALSLIDSKPENVRRILTLHFVMGYKERSEVPDMVPETEKQVRLIVAKFKKEIRISKGK